MSVRVLVVDDSPLSVDVLASRIRRDRRLEVVGVAYDGLRAVELARTLRPSVITMDLAMPKLDGLGAIERIMRERPTRILVVTAQEDRGTLAFEALRRGASDLLEKPRPHDGADVLCERLWALARAPIGRAAQRREEPAIARGASGASCDGAPRRTREPVSDGSLGARRALRAPSSLEPEEGEVTRVSALGIVASTGGPASLATVLGALPADLDATLLVVQHLPAGFAARLAKWLDGVSPLEVAIAKDGEPLAPGRVLVAGNERHLTIDRARRVRLIDGPPIDGHRPSGSRLLGSLATALGPRAAGVVLTGMGADGAEGLLALRRAGGRTAAQDEASSVVYGMPRAAAEARAADLILPLEGVARFVTRVAGRRQR